MTEPRFIRIGAPSGDGPPSVQPAAPRPAEAPAPDPTPASVLPPEVFGVWAEEAPSPPPAAPQPTAINGHGGGAPVARPRPGALRGGAVASAPTLVRHGPAHEPPARGGRVSHEDERLNEMRRSGRQVEAVCFDDLRVAGRLVAFDQYALILEADGGEAVVFKHGVILLRYAD